MISENLEEEKKFLLKVISLQINPLLQTLLKEPAMPEEIIQLYSDIKPLSSDFQMLLLNYRPSLISLACKSAKRINSLCWMMLHAGPWLLVSMFWRRLYAMSCLCLCVLNSLKWWDIISADVKKKKEPTSTSDLALFSLKAAFHYADMGLIMGGYFSEKWRLSISTNIEKDSVSLQRQEIFNRLEFSLETIPYLLHNFFNNQLWQDAMSCHPIKRPDSLRIPLLFHIFQTHTSFYSFDSKVIKTDIFPDILDTHYTTAFYIFSVDFSTLLWKVETKCYKVLATQIPTRLYDTSVWSLLNAFVYKKIPFFLRQGASHFPAIHTWKNIPQRLAKCGLLRLVPVEIGSSYSDKKWTQRIMTIQDYIENFLMETSPTNETESLGYIAQHAMLDHMPELQAELLVPDVVACVTDISNVKRLLWIGPEGTLSPYHTDSSDNIFTQIAGFKIVFLIPSHYTAEDMYCLSNLLHNTSSIHPMDIMNHPVDLTVYPRYPAKEQKVCILGPGDQLYIPQGWWHCVKSLTKSVSFSVWFESCKTP
ncbi:uncharacterized protein LOC128883342 isoform X2 [Hylaeus volcanicus]|uniref:uncharacterized protein LOC128883342 isoform X2 n=1 Tax=Hylaeus volcanicus TaxID=313075 RepID=UPI0023B873D6|nr:uncharacterized protein LOC128883342 isoform X2 [Hylaeus volcanicus]